MTTQLSLSSAGATITPQLTLTNSTTDAGQTDATLCRRTSDGLVYVGSGTLGICLGTSSERYKRDIVPMKDGLAQVLALQPKNFFYMKDRGDGGAREQFGFIAEDVVQVLPKRTSSNSPWLLQSVRVFPSTNRSATW
jgi:hypothetical protein